MKEIIKTDRAPAAIGPYSQGVKVKSGTMMFLSGIIPLEPKTMEVVGKTAAEQCQQVLTNMSQLLIKAGADLSDVVKTTIYLADLNDFAAVNEVYASFFDINPPARATVEVSRLPLDVKVEIEAIVVC